MTALTVVLIAKAAFLAWQGSRNMAQAPGEQLLIPGLRGRIISHDGEVLAWSERRLSLYWRVPHLFDEAYAQRLEILTLNLPITLPGPAFLVDLLGQSVTLAKDFPPSALENALPLLESEVLYVEMRLQRYYSTDNSQHHKLGEVAIDAESGLEMGLSGLEMQYERQLRASLMRFAFSQKDGKFSRLFNRLFSDSGNGDDVTLPAHTCLDVETDEAP
ncbi:MAG: hypothetical protein GX946_09470 [Oligosphaeraceae bacterium]|nr:hypothetical protein [Oligosphaeraceae bacterium]